MNNTQTDNIYDIKALPTAKSSIPQRKCSKDNIICRYPSSLIICGASGSGKTNVLLNLIHPDNKHLHGSYYHTILIFSPTASNDKNGLDDTYTVLNLPKENYIKDFNPDILKTLLNNRKKQIEKDGIEKVSKTDRVLLIFDDCICEKSFMHSPETLKLFVLLRHYLCSVALLAQSITKVPRGMRVNSNMLILFINLESEIVICTDEFCPSNVSKKKFREIINFCCKDRFNFMSINNHADPGKRIRKNLSDIIDLENLDKYK